MSRREPDTNPEVDKTESQHTQQEGDAKPREQPPISNVSARPITVIEHTTVEDQITSSSEQTPKSENHIAKFPSKLSTKKVTNILMLISNMILAGAALWTFGYLRDQLKTMNDQTSVMIKQWEVSKATLDAVTRAQVFFKVTKLREPLAIGKEPILDLSLLNSGQIGADGQFTDITYVFDVAPFRDVIEYQSKTASVSFSLAPTAEGLVRVKVPFVLTEAHLKTLDNGQARLFFFARGEYKDSLGRSYTLPFCRMYDNDAIMGYLITCPQEIAIK